MQTLETMRRRITSAEDLHAVVRVMKALAAVSIRQYERAVESLGAQTQFQTRVDASLPTALGNHKRQEKRNQSRQ